jgi:hypothetical protein
LSGEAHVTSILLALWLALDVQGDLTCPNPAEVSQNLARLLPSREAGPSDPRVFLSAGEWGINIELLGPDGWLFAERRLDRAGSCAEMAEAVAVILAAWQAKFSPTLATAVIKPPPESVAAHSPTIESKRSVLFDVGIAALTSLVNGKAAFGAKLEGVLLPFANPLGFHLAVSASSSHTQTIESPAVAAQWLRPALSVGPNLRWHGQTLALDVHGDAVLALLRVKGVGLAEPSSDTGAQFGLAASLRGLWTWNHAAAWIGADLLAYPGQDNLTIGNHEKVGQLPHLEIQVALGFSLGRFR